MVEQTRAQPKQRTHAHHMTVMQLSLTCDENSNVPHLLGAALLAAFELQRHECIIQLLLQCSLLINNLLVAVEPACWAVQVNIQSIKGYLYVIVNNSPGIGGSKPHCSSL